MPAPANLAAFGDIDWSARNSAIIRVATYVNAWNTYWASGTTKVVVPDQTTSDKRLDPTPTINGIINCINGMNVEFSLGVTALAPRSKTDFNSFQTILNQIITTMNAMAALKP